MGQDPSRRRRAPDATAAAAAGADLIGRPGKKEPVNYFHNAATGLTGRVCSDVRQVHYDARHGRIVCDRVWVRCEATQVRLGHQAWEGEREQ